MTVKITANFLCNGKRKEVTVETHDDIENSLERSDTSELSNIVKKLFEDELNRTVVVKVKIKKDQIRVSVNVHAAPDEI